MPEPKDLTDSIGYMGITNKECPFLPCHKLYRCNHVNKQTFEGFNCLFCYCPLTLLECPGPYVTIIDVSGIVRKDCTKCTLPHNGIKTSWKFIQFWLQRPVLWIPRHISKK
jgi:Zn-finger protein